MVRFRPRQIVLVSLPFLSILFFALLDFDFRAPRMLGFGNGPDQQLLGSGSTTPTPLKEKWEWLEVSPIATVPITGCDFLAEDDGWVTILSNSLLHWDGQGWSHININGIADEGYSLYAIDMLTSHYGWAVGEMGTMTMWDGQEWRKVQSVTDNDLLAVSFISPKLGFTSGGRGPLREKEQDWVMLQWNGINWQSISLPREKGGLAVNLVRIISPQDGWAAAHNSLYRWNGDEWIEYIESESNHLFNRIIDMSVISTADIWAVGINDEYYTGERGVIIHWNGQSWEKVATSKYELTNIHMFGPDIGWAIGILVDQENARNQDSILLSWDGSNWIEYRLPKKVGGGYICGSDVDHAWIFGGERLFSGPYSSKFVPVHYRLMKIQTTITTTPTPTPTKYQSIEKTDLPIPTVSMKVTHTADTPVEQGGENSHPVIIFSGVLLLILILGLFLRKFQK